MDSEQEFSFKNVECNDVSYYDQSDGSIIVNVLGGRPPYTYSNGLIKQTSNLFDNLKSGSYLITVTDSNNDIITSTVVVYEPFPLIIKLDINDVLKPNEKNGQIVVNVVGGLPPYTFNNGITSQNHNLFDRLKAGSYIITVTDDKINSVSELGIVTEPINLSIDEITSLDDNKIMITAHGGTPPYQYNIDKIENPNYDWLDSNILNFKNNGLYFIKVKDKFENITKHLVCILETCVGDDAVINIKDTQVPLKTITNENMMVYSNIQIFKSILPIGSIMMQIPKNSIKKNIPNKDTICSLNHKFIVGQTLVTSDSILVNDKIKTFSTNKILYVYHLKKLSKQDHIKINNLIVI